MLPNIFKDGDSQKLTLKGGTYLCSPCVGVYPPGTGLILPRSISDDEPSFFLPFQPLPFQGKTTVTWLDENDSLQFQW